MGYCPNFSFFPEIFSGPNIGGGFSPPQPSGLYTYDYGVERCPEEANCCRSKQKSSLGIRMDCHFSPDTNTRTALSLCTAVSFQTERIVPQWKRLKRYVFICFYRGGSILVLKCDMLVSEITATSEH